MSFSLFAQMNNTKNIKMMRDTISKANLEPKVLKSDTDSIRNNSTNVDANPVKIAENDLEDNVK